MRPPSTTIWPSSTSTVDSRVRLVVMMSADCTSALSRVTLEISWKILSLTAPASATCGVTRSVMPMSLRSMVWNGLVALPEVGV
ncbi:hypothetical protein D3C83_97560 [compost metagenome]